MTLYGRRLPTTPNIDALPHRHCLHQFLFSQYFYDAKHSGNINGALSLESYCLSTTRACCARTNTGNIYHRRCAAGYATGAFFSTYAYYFCRLTTGLMYCRSLSSSRVACSICGTRRGRYIRIWSFGSRVEEHYDFKAVNTLGRTTSQFGRFKAVASFEQAREIMAKLPDGFFLWARDDAA